MAVTPSTKHYYDDGDVILIVEETTFCVHYLVLSLASHAFKDMFAQISSSKERKIPEIHLTDSSEVFETLLDHIYPGTSEILHWRNLEKFLELGEKYFIQSVKLSAEKYLKTAFLEKPLIAFLLADKYGLPKAYKESSKLVLDNFSSYTQMPEFKMLSASAQLQLLETFWKYEEFLRFLAIDMLRSPLTTHNCMISGPQNPQNHVELATKELKNRIGDVLSSRSNKPSKIWEVLTKKYCENDENLASCPAFVTEIVLKFRSFLMNFEGLEINKALETTEDYLYVEFLRPIWYHDETLTPIKREM
ncbi:hypothetical protein G9A89_013172 [Geosiphon pyriformis]|nr:hypothetical protein G9A89_013172 [Geosiphon pyriformis]